MNEEELHKFVSNKRVLALGCPGLVADPDRKTEMLLTIKLQMAEVIMWACHDYKWGPYCERLYELPSDDLRKVFLEHQTEVHPDVLSMMRYIAPGGSNLLAMFAWQKLKLILHELAKRDKDVKRLLNELPDDMFVKLHQILNIYPAMQPFVNDFSSNPAEKDCIAASRGKFATSTLPGMSHGPTSR